jgi:hypothetical protein
MNFIASTRISAFPYLSAGNTNQRADAKKISSQAMIFLALVRSTGATSGRGNAREAQNQLTSVAGHAGDGSAAPSATPFFLRGSGYAEGTLFP